VIDDGDCDALELERRFSPKVGAFRYLKKLVPGLPASRNLAIKIATGDILAFFDDDVILHSDYLERIAEIYEEDAEQAVGGVGGLLFDDFHERAGWALFKRICFVGAKRAGVITRSGFPIPHRGFDTIMDVEWLSGCNMTFRKAVFNGCLFDEWFTDNAYFEDVEFSCRVSRTWRLRVSPAAKVIHTQEPRSRPTFVRTGFMEVYNYGYHFSRHFAYSRWSYFWFGVSVAAILVKNAFLALAGKQGWGYFAGNMSGLRAYVSQPTVSRASMTHDRLTASGASPIVCTEQVGARDERGPKGIRVAGRSGRV
jgi:GT2 family glycosyltransferase